MRTLVSALAVAAPLSVSLTAAGHAAGGGTIIVTSSHEYTRCIAEGGDEFYEEGDDIRICRFTSGYWEGSEIWCDANFDDCEFVTVPPSAYPGPSGQVNATTPGTATQTQDRGGAFGTATDTTQMMQLQLQD